MTSLYSVSRLRRATLHFLGGRAVQAVARAALVLLVVRLLPIADYGAYMLIVGISEMMLQLCSFGILPVGQRFLPQLVESATRRDTYRFLGIITLLQWLALAVVCAALWMFWDEALPYMGFTAEQIESSRPAVLVFMLMPGFRFTVELLQALLQQGKSQITAALAPIGRIIGIAVLLAISSEITLGAIIILDIIVLSVCLMLAWAFLLATMREVEEPGDPQPLPLHEMTQHAWHMAAVRLMGTAYTPGALRMVIANSLGIVESGLFAFLQSLQRLIGRYLPGELLRGLVRPMLIARSRAGNGLQRVERGAGLLFKANLMMVSAGAVAVLVAGDEIVAVASGGKFTDAGLSLLLMFLVLASASQRVVVDMVMQVLDLTRVLRASTMILLPTLAAVWYFARYGLDAAIAASAIGLAIANAVCMWRLRVSTGRFRIDWRGTGGIALTAVVAGLVGLTLRSVAGPWLSILVAETVLTILLLAAKPFTAGELTVVDRAFGGIARRALQPLARKVPA